MKKQYKTAIFFTVKLLVLTAIMFAGTPLERLFSPKTFAQNDNTVKEKVVHLLEEPRHRTVHRQGNLYLLDVQVNPGDTSLQHVHDQAMLLTPIPTSRGPSNGPVRSISEYAFEPFTHNVSNDGPGLLRIIALVNGGEGSSDAGDAPDGLPFEPDIENPWFRAYRLELGPGEQTSLQNHNNHTVIVQGSAGIVHVTRKDGLTRELKAAGEWEWREPGSPFIVKNMGNSSVIVAINEGRE